MKNGKKKQLAFVLGGGGSRGALQVGALRALVEAGYQPDLVTGTSIGAANGAFLAVHGYTLEGIEKLEGIWQKTISNDLLPANMWWQTMQLFFHKPNSQPVNKIRDFAIQNGITPDLHFNDLNSVYLYPVAADLNSGKPVVFGVDPDEFVLDSILASMALPPWTVPIENDGRYLMDGGAVSNLPIEAALLQGATEIIALDLLDPEEEDDSVTPGIRPFLWKLNRTVEVRQLELETKLAEANGVEVKHILLKSEPWVPIWDFRKSIELMEHGYHVTRHAIKSWPRQEKPAWWTPAGLKTALSSLVNFLD
jgi:NTE family protein